MKDFVGLLLFFIAAFILFYSEVAVARSPYGNINRKYSSLVLDANSGRVISKRDADDYRYPASLTKIMTLYMVFDALESGKLTINQKLKISGRAARQPRSKLWLKAGGTITVKDAINALIVRSANDVAVTIAEALGGTEKRFARQMTQKAWKLGMKSTRFMNASGLHHPMQVTTARDMAKLSMILMHKYEKYYPLFSKSTFKYNGTVVRGHNSVLDRYVWANGLKTGYISAAGYNIVTSATKDKSRVIAVVFGAKTSKSRDNQAIKLMNTAYSKIDSYKKRRGYVLAYNKTDSKKKSDFVQVAEMKKRNSVFASLKKVSLKKASVFSALSSDGKVT